MLLATDSEGHTFWHLATERGNLDLLQRKVREWAQEKLTAEEINKLLLATDNEGRTGWHWAALGGNLVILQYVW